ncbi:MAG TPA: thiaminase II [Thermomicrobiaceae bacterium]|nr:thiaminase II [Thermomicrobiaceae bacterium]
MGGETENLFTSHLWREIAPIYAAILEHPFLRGLTDGTLPGAAFRYYVVEDARYLRDYARCLALAAAKAPRDDWGVFFAEQAAGALVVERSLHEGFLRDWSIATDEAEPELAPANLAYTSYLLRVAYAEPFAELLGALLPCFWIYWEVGKALQAAGSPNPLYQRWIDTYAAEEYAASVRQALATLDACAAELTPERRARVARRFVTTSRYEWLFWDAAWRQETWPV